MTLVVRNYKQVAQALARAPKDVKREGRAALRRVGEHVRADAQRGFSQYGDEDHRASHTVAGAGYRVSVRQRGVEVDSRLRRTTGAHPEYGAAQMRHGLVPAAKANEPRAAVLTELAMREVARIFERRS